MKKKLTKVQRAWVRALRSGKYRKGLGWLKTPAGSYCCLGVLCELAVKARVIRDFDSAATNLTCYPKVRRWANLRSVAGSYAENNSLVCDNDGNGTSTKSFKQIAAIIESRPEGLFR